MEKFRSTASASNPFAAQPEPSQEQTPNILDLFGKHLLHLNYFSHLQYILTKRFWVIQKKIFSPINLYT